ncbi:uncharacterized protein LOC142164023 [Nicotiana tabacum]|uniref:Uncharacterized protein LOC142164023 n=1 Tax=Nicotiana tabacum TaxID=4097 RepID=A0AC58RX42_TOBAC
MWNKLEVTYEGTNKVKTNRINLLVHDYELFQMKEGESIEEMFTRFSKIIGDLKAFGKPYSSGDQVRKILRSLPTTCQTKVVVLESQYLDKLSYDELRGDIIAFEKTHLKKTRQEEKKKMVAFKTTTEGPENDIDDPEDLEEEIAMVSRNMNGLMKRYRNTKKGRMSSRRTRQYNEQDKNDGKCFKCGRYDHVQAECPDLKRNIFRGDEDASDNECKEDTENYFMARGEVSEVRPYNCDKCNELRDILDLTLKESQKMLNELKRFNREKKDKELKLEVCEMERDVLQDKVRELQMQLNGMHKFTGHSSVKSNHATYKPTGKGPVGTESTNFISQMFQDGFGNPKIILIPVELTNKDPSKLGYLKEGDDSILQEHHRKSCKEKWYLDSVCSSHMTGDKNLFKEVKNK